MKLGAGLALLAVAGGAAYYLATRDGAEDPAKSKYVTAKLERGALLASVAATGVVEAQAMIQVKSRASGQVKRFPHEEGDEVKQGELLVELDGTEENRSLQVATANLKVAQAEAAKAKALLDGFKIESKLDVVSEDAKVAAAQAQVEKARTALSLFQKEHPSNLAALKNQVAGASAELVAAEKALARAKQLKGKVTQSEVEAAEASHALKKVAHRKLELDLKLAESTYALKLADRRQEIVRLEAALRTAQAMRDRLQQTAGQNLAMKQADLRQAEARVATAKVEVARAQDRLEFTKIYAELDGVIVTKSVEKGQVISSGTSSASGGDALATLADLDVLYVTADVDESDIGKVLSRQQARITVDTYPDKTFRGRVVRVAPSGIEENNVVIFKVRIRVYSLRRRILRSFLEGKRGPDVSWARTLSITPAQRKPLEAAFKAYVAELGAIRETRRAAGAGANRAKLRLRYVRGRKQLEAALRKHLTPAQYERYNRRFLRIGMSANVEIETGRVDDALLVPTPAIRRQNKQRGVFVLADGEPVFKSIGKVLLQTGEKSAVALEGGELKEGDPVVVRGMARRPSGGGNGRGSPLGGMGRRGGRFR